MKNIKKFKARRQITQWTNPNTGRLEVKPLIEMTEAEFQKEGGLRLPPLNINRNEFVKTKKEKSKLKHFKKLNRKKSNEIKLHDQKEMIDRIANSKVPRWGSFSISVQ